MNRRRIILTRERVKCAICPVKLLVPKAGAVQVARAEAVNPEILGRLAVAPGNVRESSVPPALSGCFSSYLMRQKEKTGRRT